MRGQDGCYQHQAKCQWKAAQIPGQVCQNPWQPSVWQLEQDAGESWGGGDEELGFLQSL